MAVSARHGDAGWAFSVRDNGIGLPKDSAIFEMFKRGGGEHDRAVGIGLTCGGSSRGSRWAHLGGARAGGGSNFLFTLPV